MLAMGTRQRLQMRLLVVVLFTLCAAGTARAELEVISLHHRTVDQVLPAVQPFVERGGAIQGMSGQIIVRSSPENIAEIRRLIATIDTPIRRLLISVRQDAAGSERAGGIGVSGNVSGSAGGVTVGRPSGPNRVDVAVGERERAIDDRVTQQVQGLEGSPSFISVGSSVPVATTTRGPGGTVTTTTGFQQIDTGFQVVPRIAGDRVFLDILPQRATPGRYRPGGANVQRISTTVSGRLGEWIPLGGVGIESSSQASGIASRGTASTATTSGVWVRVEEIK